MKRKFIHPEPTEADLNGPLYWKSADELANTPEYQQWLEREFPAGASEADETDRRTFLKLMGASAGLAGVGMAGCRGPEEKILPYSKQPEQMVQGVAIYYSSAWPGPKAHTPLIVETHQARPTKIEGNPSYAEFGGATEAFAQAEILNLYDPDRFKHSFKGKGKSARRIDRVAATQELLDLAAAASQTGGKGLAVLAQPSPSPSRIRLIERFRQQYPNALWAEYEPVATDRAEKAMKQATGQRLRPHYRLDKAKRVLSLDSDFLGSDPGHLQWSRDFMKGRAVYDVAENTEMNRLYAVESNFSQTGAMADHRLRVPSSHIEVIAQMFLDGARGRNLNAYGSNVDLQWIRECWSDMSSMPGEALVIAGEHQPESVQQLVFQLNEALDATGKTIEYLKTHDYSVGSIADVASGVNDGTIETLVILGGNPAYDAPADLEFGKVLEKAKKIVTQSFAPNETTMLSDVSIAATHFLEHWGDGRTLDGTYVPVQPMILPIFPGFSELEVISALLGQAMSEGAARSLVQETFAAVTGESKDLAFEKWLAEGVWAETKYPVVASPRASINVPKANAPKVTEDELEVRIVPSSHAYDGRFNNNGWMMECPDPMTRLTWDNVIAVSSKMADKLGILPEPKRMDEIGALHREANVFDRGAQVATMAEITVDGQTIRGPLHCFPGLADNTVVVSLGFGRRVSGRIGMAVEHQKKGQGTGFDAFPLVTTKNPSFRTGAKLKKLDETFKIANVQQHWSMEGRAIVREAPLIKARKYPKFANKMGVEAHAPPNYGKEGKELSVAEKALSQPRGNSAYKTPAFEDPAPNVKVWQGEEAMKHWIKPQQWGMTIDLNTCIGCNACVIACQAENNIPIVGKDQVMRGREMHWIRIDRYFISEQKKENAPVEKMVTGGPEGEAAPDTLKLPDDPQVSFIGIACQHCELAPCEQVCPVNATVHDEEGLNVMAYNRCVGTRYCANNCPYKVRRFNFFDYNKRERGHFYEGPLGPNKDKQQETQMTQMQKNPDVTIRMRGVMEKCTYCVQRIQEAKINQKVKAAASNDIKVPDGVITPACAQVCPTDAIVFGDIADENSRVNHLKKSNRNYSVLGYLNIRPRTTYLAKLRNPNEKMPDYQKQPISQRPMPHGHGSDDHGKKGDHGANSHGAYEESAAKETAH